MKKITSTVFIIILMLSNTANAALIDNGSYTTDDINNLDWLDLSATTNQSIDTAPSLNIGWRTASNSEVEDLFNQIFPSYADTNIVEHRARVSPGTALYDEAQMFVSLLGRTSTSCATCGYGFYIDEDSIPRILGADIRGTPSIADILSPEFITQYTSDQTSLSIGVFMVRTSVVPVPAAVWLFGSGLIALAGLSRRRK